MSVKAWEKYQPNASSPSPQYPYGSLRQETALGMGDGTPLDVEWGNDFEAFKQTAFSRSGLVPSGNTDTVTNSEMFNAMQDSTTRSLWERSAAESGYNLVVGSFEEGGALVNTNDVLWSKKLNKIFSGPAGVVAAGTNPASGGFVDRSGALSAFKLNAVTAKLREVRYRLVESVHVTDFSGVVLDGVTDCTLGFREALLFCHNFGFRLHIPAGVMRITDTATPKLGDTYTSKGIAISGDGKGASRILFDYTNTASPKNVIELIGDSTSGYNFDMRDVGVSVTNTAAVSNILYSNILMAGVNLRDIDLSAGITSIRFKKSVWLSSFDGIGMSPRDNGFIMEGSGTSNRFDRLFVYGSSVCAYRLAGSYSSVGSLAADDCTGLIYDLRYLSGVISSLGVESPVVGRTPTTVIKADFGNLQIGFVRGFRICPTNGSAFTLLDCGSGNTEIKHIFVDQNDQSSASSVVNGVLINGYRGSVKIGTVVAVKDGNDLSSTKLTFNNQSPVNTLIELDPKDGTSVSSVGDSKPFMGMGYDELTSLSGISTSLQLRPPQNIYFDAAGGPKGSGVGSNYSATRDQFKKGATQGSLMLEVDPKARGCAGYSVTQTGSDMNGTQVARIPIIEVIDTTATLPTAELWDGRSVKVRALHKTLTYYTYGSAGWYDESGAKIV